MSRAVHLLRLGLGPPDLDRRGTFMAPVWWPDRHPFGARLVPDRRLSGSCSARVILAGIWGPQVM